MDIFAVIIVYAGFLLAVTAVLSVIWPLKIWPFYTRKRSAIVLALAVLAIGVGLLLPQREQRITESRTKLDEFMPVYLFHEVHEREVLANCDQVYAAIWSVTPGEIALYRQLTWMRRFGRSGKPSILNAPETRPLLETALHSGFFRLSEAPGQEIVVGVLMAAPPGGARFSAASFTDLQTVKATMNFRVVGSGDGRCRVITETRGYANSTRGRRIFAAYWRIIYPGSALIRRMWLRGIQRRAERSVSSVRTGAPVAALWLKWAQVVRN